MTRRACLLAVAVSFGASCQRVPEEPPARIGADTSTAPVANARCMKPTPPTPPPAAPRAASCPPDPDGAQPPLALVKVEFVEAAPLVLEAELARSADETQRGLMYRTSMPDDRGMLFHLGARREQSFWMRNTCIPLDMLFIDDDGFIVGILENVPTLNEESRSVGCPSTHVLETNAGWTRRHGVKAGQRVLLPPAAR